MQYPPSSAILFAATVLAKSYIDAATDRRNILLCLLCSWSLIAVVSKFVHGANKDLDRRKRLDVVATAGFIVASSICARSLEKDEARFSMVCNLFTLC